MACSRREDALWQLTAQSEWDFVTYGLYDVRPVGSRPLAHERIKLPVAYTDEVSVRATPPQQRRAGRRRFET